MRFKIAYCLYLIVCIFYSVIPLFGAITIRHVFTVLILVLCFFEKGIKLDRFLKWYLTFLLFYVLSAALTGYLSEVTNKLLGTYLASIVLYMATKVMVKKYKGGFIVISVLLGLALINSIVAIGQYYDSSIADTIIEKLHIQINEDKMGFDILDLEMQKKYVGGVLGVVRSGFFLSASCVLAFYSNKTRIQLYNWIVFIVVFYALFLVQERSGFYIGIACAFLYVVFVTIRKPSTILISIVVFIIAITLFNKYGSQYVFWEDMRYSNMGFEIDNRDVYAKDALNYLRYNLMGGYSEYVAKGGGYPHNCFVNALLYGGIFGGSILIVMYFVQIWMVIKVMYNYVVKKSGSTMLLVFSLAYLTYMVNSLVHNASFAAGNEMFFLLWAAIVSLLETKESIPERKSRIKKLLKRILLLKTRSI